MKIPDDYDLPKELAKLEKKIQAKNTEYIHIYEQTKITIFFLK